MPETPNIETARACPAPDACGILARHAPVVLVVLDLAGTIEYVNPYFEQLTGFPSEELHGKSWFETFLPERHRDNVGVTFQQAISGRATTGNVNPIVLRSGEEREIEWYDQLERDATGEPLRLVAIGIDVTQRIRDRQRAEAAESARTEQEQALRRSDARLREAQQTAHLGSWDLDLVSNELHWSDEAFRIFEIDRTSFGASYEAFLDLVHPDDRDMVNHAYTHSVETKTPYALVHRLVMKDGRIKHVQERCHTDYDANGRPVRSAGTVQDITDRVRTELELRDMRDQLDQRVRDRTAELETANRKLEAYSYTVSHDLKAPLRAMEGYSRLLREDFAPKIGARGLHLIQSIHAATTRMNRLIDDLLAYSRLNHQSLQPSRIDVAALLQDLINERGPDLKAKNIGIRTDVTCGDVVAERYGLTLALRNLLDNAINHGSSAKRPELDIGAREEDGAWLLWIRDNGAGIPANDQHRAFDLFERLPSCGDNSGTGIGLAIVRAAIERVGGKIWIESAPGEGATFCIQLPK